MKMVVKKLSIKYGSLINAFFLINKFISENK